MRIFLVSDIHSNWTALKAVNEVVQRLARDLRETRYFCLGDLVGYGPVQGSIECLRWLRNNCSDHGFWLPGNHDEWLVTSTGKVSREATASLLAQQAFLARPEYREDWELFSSQVKGILARSLDAVDLRADLAVHPFDGSDGAPSLVLGFTHGGLQPGLRREEYLFPWTRELLAAALRTFQGWYAAPSMVLACGHTHFPFCAVLEEGHIRGVSIKYGAPIPISGIMAINPGSVGQPRDGDARAAFAAIDTDERTVTFYRAEYDREAVITNLSQEADYGAMAHPLSKEERRDVLNKYQERLKNEDKTISDKKVAYKSWKDAYLKLIDIQRTGDGGTLREDFLRFYRRPDWDLEAI